MAKDITIRFVSMKKKGQYSVFTLFSILKINKLLNKGHETLNYFAWTIRFSKHLKSLLSFNLFIYVYFDKNQIHKETWWNKPQNFIVCDIEKIMIDNNNESNFFLTNLIYWYVFKCKFIFYEILIQEKILRHNNAYFKNHTRNLLNV